MNMRDFLIYKTTEENEDGIYWKFANTPIEELNNCELFYPDISNIIKKIKNKELKEKMKNKLLSLIKKNGILMGIGNLEIFTEDEIENLIENDEFYEKLNTAIKNNNVHYFFPNVLNFSNILKKLENFDFIIYNYSRIIDNLKECNDSEKYIAELLDDIKYYPKLNEFLIEKYYDSLPEIYKNFIKITNNRNYILNKTKKYEKERIGIDPNIKIGPEIETNHPYNLFFPLSDQYGYEDYGRTHRDPTVYKGIEISCEPFSDTPDDIAKFHALCDTLTEMGYYYDEKLENASGQINLGLDYLDTKQAVLNFFEIYGNCEELLFYISNEEGQISRQEIYYNNRCKPISEIIGTRVINEDAPREGIISLFYAELGRTCAINGLEYKQNTVCVRGKGESLRLEFRIPNGGNNFKTWKDNIRLYGKIMEISKKLADMLKKDYLTDEEQRLLRLKYDLQDKNLSLEEKLIILMKLLEFDDETKQIYYDRYDSVIKKIQETGTKKYEDSKERTSPAFDEVNFFEKYKTKYDGEFDVAYDPNTDEYIEKRRTK